MNMESVFSICESSVSRLNRSVKMNSKNAVDHSFFDTDCSVDRNRSGNEVASIMRRFCRLQFVAFRVFSRHALQLVRSLRQSLQKVAFRETFDAAESPRVRAHHRRKRARIFAELDKVHVDLQIGAFIGGFVGTRGSVDLADVDHQSICLIVDFLPSGIS